MRKKTPLQLRFMALGKCQKDLIPELKKRGEHVTEFSLSHLLDVECDDNKARTVKALTDEIVTAWEIETEG